ncbi:MAG: hypothetical protein L0H83_14330 [Salinisphaera sp.]|nr:hypothetical protein [Salinisphaera sp.]
MQPLTREQILALIPHAGAMCLLDRVLRWNSASIHCHSDASHRDRDHPLRRNGGLVSVHLIEYGAQAAAVHAGLLARESGRPAPAGGFLAALRDVVLGQQQLDGIAGALYVRAACEMAGAQGMIYRFAVESAGAPLASGRLTIMGVG